jgi:hypothetical protein
MRSQGLSRARRERPCCGRIVNSSLDDYWCHASQQIAAVYVAEGHKRPNYVGRAMSAYHPEATKTLRRAN